MSSIVQMERVLWAKRPPGEPAQERAKALAPDVYATVTSGREPKSTVAGDGLVLPRATRCPLTGKTFVHPVVLLGDGYTYEQAALADCLTRLGPVSPMTQRQLTSFVTVPNRLMAQYIAAREAHESGDIELRCAVSLSTMSEPIINNFGHTYDAASLAPWYAVRADAALPITSPLSNEVVDTYRWVDNHSVAQLIDECTTLALPVHHAAATDDVTSLRLHLGGPQPWPEHVLTPLALASRHGNLGCVRALVNHGVSIDAYPSADPQQRTALYWACSRGHASVVSVLLSAGAQVNSGKGLLSPLMQAARQGYTDIIDSLLQAGADVSAQHEGHNPLWFAAFNGHDAARHKLLRAFVRYVADAPQS